MGESVLGPGDRERLKDAAGQDTASMVYPCRVSQLHQLILEIALALRASNRNINTNEVRRHIFEAIIAPFVS